MTDDGRADTVGFKLAEGKGLREGRDSKELWKSVEKGKGRTSRQSAFRPPKLGPASLRQWQIEAAVRCYSLRNSLDVERCGHPLRADKLGGLRADAAALLRARV